MMQFQINLIDFVNFYILFIILCSVSANTNDQNYDNQLKDSANFNNEDPIKPVGGYGHPKFTPRLTQEQIELPNPYLVTGNPDANQNNCKGVYCHEPTSLSNIDQVYNPYNYIQQTTTNINKRPYDNISPYDVNTVIDRQYHQIAQQQPTYHSNIETNHQIEQQQPTYQSNIETNLPSSSYQNNFGNHNQQRENTVNHEPNQQHTYGNQMENSNYKIVVPHVSNNNVDINFILEQQNEHLRVLLHKIKQQQLKIMQTVMDIQHYVQNLPTRSLYWSVKQIQNEQNPINLYPQPVRGIETIPTNSNDYRYFNNLSKNSIQTQQSVGMQ